MSMSVPVIPRAFVWRRLHSLFGLWIVLFLIEHLFTNSQAALLFGDDGVGFINAVNFIKGLPYLQLVESLLIGIPILFHSVLGVKYLFTASMNSFRSDGSKPSLREYPRNHAYTWQRITSWILLVGIIAHVSYMRFYKYPIQLTHGEYSTYITRIKMDTGLYTVADRLKVQLYDQDMVEEAKKNFEENASTYEEVLAKAKAIEDAYKWKKPVDYSPEEAQILNEAQHVKFQKEWVKALEKKKLRKGQILAVSKNFGTSTLLNVRDSFMNIPISILYTIFVVAAAFHAFNGLWTFLLTWGVIIKMRTQAKAVNVCVAIMIIVAFLGLASIWGTYWINLRN